MPFKRYHLYSLAASLGLVVILLALAANVPGARGASNAGDTAPGKGAQPNSPNDETLPPGVVIETVLTNLSSPIAMAFDSQGRLFFTEKLGAVRLVVNDVLQEDPVTTFDVDYCFERGLLGIALDPNFDINHFIYVYYTEYAGEPCAGTSTWNRVVRFTELNGTAVPGSKVVIFSIPQQAGMHVGGNIHFGPDGKLYVTTGDNANPANAQDLNVRNGKIHRINPEDGSPPSDNPVFTQTGTLTTTYAIGLRNSFDFTFDPLSGNLFATENGPSCDDELNRIEAGYNYGWRENYVCEDDSPIRQYNTIDPIWYLGNNSPDPHQCCISPTGIEVYTGTLIPQWTNQLFMCTLKETSTSQYGTANLYHFYLDASRDDLVSPSAFDIVSGVECGLDIETAPNGTLYYFEVTSNIIGTLKRIIPASMATITPATSTPTASPTATVTPVIPGCTIQFQDVAQDNTFYPFINCLACRNIIGGYPCGGPGEPCGDSGDPYYRPGANVTRGQISKIVSEAAGFLEDPGAQVYEDVEPGSPFYNWINRLSNRGYMSGYPCGGPDEPCEAGSRPYFRPNASATRGQLSKIVSNAAGLQDAVAGQDYQDVPPSDDPSSFYPYIQRLSSIGSIGGYPCGTPDPNSGPCDDQDRPYFRPGNLVTRGQAAKIVSNTFYPDCQPRPQDVDIAQFAYHPAEVTVKVGTTVSWTNFDLDYHTVTSPPEAPGPLNSPNIQQNETWAYTFNTPGEYQYYCSPHTYMRGKVIVVP